MSLNAALKLLLDEYPTATKTEYKNNTLAAFIRTEIPAYLAAIAGSNPRYLFQGSPGKGNWAAVPWAAVLDRFITETVQDGYYVVYLVKEDFSGIYLSLNQGVTTVQKQYGSEAREALSIRAKNYLARFGKLEGKYITGAIDLACGDRSKLGPLYEQGSILALYYPVTAIPNDPILSQDLIEILEKYFLLTSKESQLFPSNETEDDETSFAYEDLKKVRIHKRIERNKKLAAKVKQLKGCTCQACGFNFENIYGSIGAGFIEAHHLTPLHTLTGDKVALDPIKDFAVLCANCHRMIHKSKTVSNIEEFRLNHILSSH